MMKRIISGVIALTMLASLGLAGACAGDVQAKTGTIEVRITDAPPEYDIATIDVTFSEVAVHKAGDDGEEGVWITLEISNGELELLELEAADLEALLAAEEVTAGKYTQLRVIIGAIAVTLIGDDEPPEVILPSGELKFVRPFEVIDGETTILLLDFDADKSLIVTGDGRIIVKPVVKLAIQQGGKPQELASVEGTIIAVDTEASTISIIPDGETEAVVLDVNSQTEITLDGEPATISELTVGQGVTASYYLNNLEATQIDALSP